MKRLMIIPAAGRGSRLKSPLPKILFPVGGRPMIDHLLDLYGPLVERFVLVLHPSFAEEVRRHCAGRPERIGYEVQGSPTGMLDAILIPERRVREYQPASVWVTWCDQIGVRPETVRRLADTVDASPEAALVFPTMEKPEPYIHLVRDRSGGIISILHRREGDRMPDVGEGDMGLFGLTRAAYLDLLTEFARDNESGAATGERNFLPFIPWLRGREAVKTFAGLDEMESVGVNDANDLRLMEEYLRFGGRVLAR